MKKFLGIMIPSFILIYLLMWYLFLPRLNFQAGSFHVFLGILLSFIIFIVCYIYRDKIIERAEKKGMTFKPFSNKVKKIYSPSQHYTNTYFFFLAPALIFGIIVSSAIIYGVIGSKMFRAKSYANQLSIETGSEEEFKSIYAYDSTNVLLPVIDKDLAFRLAEARLSEYGAQYEIDKDNFTLLSVERDGVPELVRIAPLEYSNLFVSLNRMTKGTIGYIEVNVVTKEAKLVEFKDGLKYMSSSKFNYDLDRHIRFKYPTEMYDEKYFEIDNQGNPYWVIPTYRNEISVFSGKTSSGVIVCNAINGELAKYSLGNEPTWVDRVVLDDLVESQATNAFKYKNGFINATIGSKSEVLQLSDGYNYFIKDGHTYLVSCITSPNNNDQTSVGFITIDLKNRHAVKYLISGITEMRARDIAMQDERVKAQVFDATWPILINYEGIPTYFLVLKNDVQAQKIVFINVNDGSLVAMGNDFTEARNEYNKLIAGSGNVESDTITGVVSRLRDTGSTIEFMLEGINDVYFEVDVNLSLSARFMKVNDKVTVKYRSYNGYNYVTGLEIN